MKILIVEDDYIVRKGIILSLDWEKEGFEICGEAANGVQGFERVQETQPDIILTDIRMPVEDGLSFSQRVREQFPDTQIVILSGYEDFAYAKKALKIGVFDYLLKPVNAEELLSTVIHLREKIIKQREEYNKELYRQSFVEENYGDVRNNILNSLIVEDLSNEGQAEKVLGRLNKLGMKLNTGNFQITLISVQDFLVFTRDCVEKRKTLIQKIEEMIGAILHLTEDDFVFHDKNMNFVVLLQQIWIQEEWLQALHREMKESCGFDITIAAGLVKHEIVEIQNSYREALLALRRRAYLPGQYIIHYAEDMNKQNPMIQKAIKYIENHFAEEIRIEQVVAELYVTPNYFSQIFKSETGVNYSDYLNQYRVERAKDYLENTEFKVYQVSEKVGYQNYKYFHTVFRKYAGCSPKEYRNRLGAGEEVEK